MFSPRALGPLVWGLFALGHAMHAGKRGLLTLYMRRGEDARCILPSHLESVGDPYISELPPAISETEWFA